LTKTDLPITRNYNGTALSDANNRRSMPTGKISVAHAILICVAWPHMGASGKNGNLCNKKGRELARPVSDF
jgi:hypothetical protein